MFRLHVDPNRCQGHGVCLDEAPAQFVFDDDTTQARSTGQPLPDSAHSHYQDIADLCPTAAITLIEQEKQ
ncbi:hypothetical protein MKUB_30270 [Mycobacterium kubicae]|uniref:Ferredoxin n=1 Tax=Mycobacterium kubicae TaxID=120959 RepID=A0AAX1J9V1_9MYCO|nr:ferredoxin [Mycobacterium kubicae]MCV7094278.1 ferredoxin [Mycobacterium kubicae]ORV98934.1 hypothetical protein AWC13_12075 [Mycobacterium kubicae]QNI09917.1 ferredoxin [Mycobacterium kubicae]QPI38113.1 ferredoxin [Mycobacterium kubicae]GFG65537.1 hypothetical protein MKUB_30270 [Mycobacterium kubicae]